MKSARVSWLLSSCLLALGCAQPAPSLMRAEEVAPGTECAAGGKRLSFGADKDGSGVLEDDEVVSSTFVCNGVTGATGPNGSDGTPGKAVVTATAPATQAECPGGGSVFMAGQDDDADGTLDLPGEVDTSVKVCNGDAGASGYSALVVTAAEPRGLNCPAAGVRLDVGVDNGDDAGTAGDGVLQPGEIDQSRYLCAAYEPVFRVASATAAHVVTPALGSETPMTVAWDGTSYWFSSGTDLQGGRLVQMDSAFNPLASFPLSGPSGSYRGITTRLDGTAALYATLQQDTTVYMINPANGARTSFRLMYPSFAPEAQITWDSANGEWVGRSGSTYGRYDQSFNRLGTFQGPSVTSNSQLAVLALKGRIVLYEDGAKRLTVFSRDGVALEQLTLPDGPTSCFGMSVANGQVWLSDGSTQSFKAYDVLK